MSNRRSNCRLLDADGRLLANATCRLGRTQNDWTALLTGFDAPGLVVRRCLLDHVRDVWLAVDGGVACPARVDQVFFDTSLGRACRLRIDAGAALLLAQALEQANVPAAGRPTPLPAGNPVRLPAA